ncbi:MAG TPA: DUF1549 domain-containing protein, partial [Planctomycetaceae bacterium]|nr:DUF1549 domain-containing protein [Planctomycetaceae bacterium]
MSQTGRICPWRGFPSTVPAAVLIAGLALASAGRPPAVSAAAPDARSPEPPNPAQVLIGQYQERVKKGEWDQVIRECSQGIDADPKNFAAYVGRGIALNAKGDYEEAIRDFDAATGIGGRDPASLTLRAEAFANRSFALHQQGKYLDAINSAYFALLEKGDHAAAHHFRAMAYIGWDKPDKAIQSADRAIQLNPNFAEAYSTRGYAYGMKGNVDKAIEDESKALQIQPNLAGALERRAAAYLTKGKADEAAKDIDQALKLKPDFPEALADRAVLNGMRGNSAQALADLGQAVKLKPESFRAHYQRGGAFLAYGKPEQALESLNEAIRLKGDFVAALILRGNLLSNRKEYAKAVEDYSKVLLLDPKFAAAYMGRSQAYKKLGMHAEAQADQARLHELQPPPEGKSAKKKDQPPRFQVVSREVVPSRRPQALQAAREIDALVEASYQKYGVTPNPTTTDSQFVRRIYLDITGTIPTFQQTKRFLSNREPAKRAILIDELLNSDGYASHYFNYWADVLRYTDQLTLSVRGEPYRQWIKQSLAENKPWNKFVGELLMAEGLIWQNPATGYLQRDANMPLDNMNNTVRIFLGTRIGCAQCHNHPFDRWTMNDYYGWASFFSQVGRKPGEDPRETIIFNSGGGEVNHPVSGKPVPPTLLGGVVPDVAGKDRRQLLAKWLASPDNPYFAKNLANIVWNHFFGQGIIHEVDDVRVSNPASNQDLIDELGKRFTA